MHRNFSRPMRPDLTGRQAAEALTPAYAQTPLHLAVQYRRMVAGHVPPAFNCPAGKNHTGIVSALGGVCI